MPEKFPIPAGMLFEIPSATTGMPFHTPENTPDKSHAIVASSPIVTITSGRLPP